MWCKNCICADIINIPATGRFMLKANLKTLIGALSAGVLVCSAHFANAVILEGDFSGRIFQSNDQFNSLGLGAGIDTLVGETVSGRFTIDTDLIPSDSDLDPEIGRYQQSGNDQWFTFELETSFGHVWSSEIINSSNDGNLDDTDFIETVNDYQAELRNSLQVGENSMSNTNIWRQSFFMLFLLSTNDSGSYSGQDFLISEGFPFAFNIADYNIGLAEGYVIDTNMATELNISYYFGLDSLSWGLPSAKVSESSSVFLMAIGIFGLIFSRRKSFRSKI